MKRVITIIGPTFLFWGVFVWSTLFGRDSFDHLNFEISLLLTLVVCMDVARRIEIMELQKAVEALKNSEDISKEQKAAKKSRASWASFGTILLVLTMIIFTAVDSENRKAEYRQITQLRGWLVSDKQEQGRWPESGILVQKLRVLDYGHEDGELQSICGYGTLNRHRVRITTKGDYVRFKQVN
jgi:hypothetical protein